MSIKKKNKNKKPADQVYDPSIRTKDLKQTFEFQKVRIINDFLKILVMVKCTENGREIKEAERNKWFNLQERESLAHDLKRKVR